MALQLDADRTKMDAYVASRINLMAPNVAAIVGPPYVTNLFCYMVIHVSLKHL